MYVLQDVGPPAKRVKRNTAPEDGGLIYLYSDVLASSRVGNYMGKLLRILPPPEAGPYFTFDDRYYFPLERTTFSTVSIMLTDKTGELYPFETGDDPTVVTLHIKCVA